MHQKYATSIWEKAHCLRVVSSYGMCVGRGTSETWRQDSDTCIHMHTCTRTHSHTLYLAAWLITASLGVLEKVQKNHFSFKKIFQFFWTCHYYYKTHHLSITSLLLLSPSHHLISVRWRRSCRSLADTVTNPTFPQSLLLSHQVIASNVFAGSRFCYCFTLFSFTESE